MLYALEKDTFVVDINVLHVLVDLGLCPDPPSWPNSSGPQKDIAKKLNKELFEGQKGPTHPLDYQPLRL